jgi:general stress protein YciG
MAGKSLRGFGAMDREKQRQIASKGGKAAHQKGTAHEFTPEEARAAGRKGGQAAHRKGTAHQFTPQEAAEAGRKGGKAAHQRNPLRPSGSESYPSTPVNNPAFQGNEQGSANGVGAPSPSGAGTANSPNTNGPAGAPAGGTFEQRPETVGAPSSMAP